MRRPPSAPPAEPGPAGWRLPSGKRARDDHARPGRTGRLLALTLLLGAVTLPGRAAEATGLPDEVTALLARAGVPERAVSAVVAPLPGPPGTAAPAAPRLSHRPDAAMHPASVMKLVTTYAGLDLLGAGYTWTNRVYTHGPVREGVLHGDLILRGSGDPKLVHERLDALLRQVIAAGVREVRGDLVLDRSVFRLPPHDPAAFDDEPLRPYNAAPDGLLVNFKALILRFSPEPDGSGVRVQGEPPLADVTWPTRVPAASGPCGDWRAALQADFRQTRQLRLDGAYPLACGERDWAIAFPDPDGYAPRLLRALWAGAGGRLDGQVREGTTPRSARLLLTADSLPLGEIVADINKFSNNVMAQQLFLTLSAQAEGRGSFAASRRRLRDWWQQHLHGHPPPVLDNGSGLSRAERSSAAALTALLQLAAAGRQADAFARSLAVAGVDGTLARLAERLPGSVLIGNAQLKTGSLRDVAALAGYATGRSGQRYSVVALVNHAHAAAARPALERLVEWVIQDQ